MPEANGKALAAGRAELDTIFASAPIFYLDHDGDWVRGTITAVDSVTTEYGTSPQIEFTLINGESFKSGPATPGTLWRVAIFGKLASAAFDKEDPRVGDDIAMMNKGKITTREGDRTYTDMRLKILTRKPR